MTYQDFLSSKALYTPSTGFYIPASKMNPLLFPWQRDIVSWALRKGKAAMFEDCGLGKCHGKGTRILMYDCSVKKVEDIKIGDQLMGDDGTPRNVLSLAHGEDELYKVTLKNGDAFTCNSDHILSCEVSNRHRGHQKGDVVNIPIKEILAMKPYVLRNSYMAYKRPLNFRKKEVPFDPYVYGVWLGDGSSNRLSFTICDKDQEIVDYLSDWATRLGLSTRIEDGRGCLTYHYSHGAASNQKYPELSFVQDSSVGGKHIFKEYLVNDRETRLQLLAGLLDTDGYLQEKCYEIATKFPRLRDDILFLSRSLGFSVKHGIKRVNDKDYYRISISGNTEDIPCKTRKKAGVRKQIKNPLCYGMQIESIGRGEYFGFLIDGNHLYLLDDFTVTHNTAQQLEWSDQVIRHTQSPVLIVAPLAVAEQTQREGVKFGYEVTVCRTQQDVRPGINITNYEMLDHFDSSAFSGVVLDESSILKNFSGKMRTQIIQMFRDTPYKLSCTATPSPNDYMELGNQAEFLGVMTRSEMLACYFIHDGGSTSHWRLKGHAQDLFWQWLATWCVVLTTPADLGYDQDGYDLPKLHIREMLVDSPGFDGQLAQTLTERRNARRDSLLLRCVQAEKLVAQHPNEQWLVWCDLNAESDLLHSLIPDSVEVRGSDKPDHKTAAFKGFTDGSVQCLVSKPSIAGFGLNFQCCHNMIFVGLSDSYEMLYQAIRRCYRFGQEQEVNVWIITSSAEGAVLENVKHKEEQCKAMIETMVTHTKEILSRDIRATERISMKYEPQQAMVIPDWLRRSNAV